MNVLNVTMWSKLESLICIFQTFHLVIVELFFRADSNSFCAFRLVWTVRFPEIRSSTSTFFSLSPTCCRSTRDRRWSASSPRRPTGSHPGLCGGLTSVSVRTSLSLRPEEWGRYLRERGLFFLKNKTLFRKWGHFREKRTFWKLTQFCKVMIFFLKMTFFESEDILNIKENVWRWRRIS